MTAKIGVAVVAIGMLLSVSGASARGSDAVVKTQIGAVSFTIAELAVGKPSSDLVRMISVGMKRGCTEARSVGMAPGRPLAIVWRLRNDGPRPVIHISAELFSRGRAVASSFVKTTAIDAAPNVVFESAVSQITCSLFRNAGYVRFAVPRSSDAGTKTQGLAFGRG